MQKNRPKIVKFSLSGRLGFWGARGGVSAAVADSAAERADVDGTDKSGGFAKFSGRPANLQSSGGVSDSAKSAFTMIELIFAIVIIGILSALAVGKFDLAMQLSNARSLQNSFDGIAAGLARSSLERLMAHEKSACASISSLSSYTLNCANLAALRTAANACLADAEAELARALKAQKVASFDACEVGKFCLLNPSKLYYANTCARTSEGAYGLRSNVCALSNDAILATDAGDSPWLNGAHSALALPFAYRLASDCLVFLFYDYTRSNIAAQSVAKSCKNAQALANIFSARIGSEQSDVLLGAGGGRGGYAKASAAFCGRAGNAFFDSDIFGKSAEFAAKYK